jgi:RNase P subunit RPR2
MRLDIIIQEYEFIKDVKASIIICDNIYYTQEFVNWTCKYCEKLMRIEYEKTSKY